MHVITFFIAMLLTNALTGRETVETPPASPTTPFTTLISIPPRYTAQMAQPTWFQATTGDLRADNARAVAAGKTLLLYVASPACAYCEYVVNEYFSVAADAAYVQQYFYVVGLNAQSEEKLLDFAGEAVTQAVFLKREGFYPVPTLVFIDGAGKVIQQIRGYYPSATFRGILRYVADRVDKNMSLMDYLVSIAPPRDPEAVLFGFHLFVPPPHNLFTLPLLTERPTLVLFERKGCYACEVLHRDFLNTPAAENLLKHFDVVRVDVESPRLLTLSTGSQLSYERWAMRLGIFYTPTWVFLNKQGEEFLRVDYGMPPSQLEVVLQYVLDNVEKSVDAVDIWEGVSGHFYESDRLYLYGLGQPSVASPVSNP